MLWFIGRLCVFANNSIAFKYILCYGSSDRPLAKEAADIDLNTSYVMVHHITGKAVEL